MRLITFLFLFLFLLGLSVSAQNTVLIKGKVVDEAGEPLPGASVYIDKSTIAEKSDTEGMVTNYNLGTVADINGEFSLSVPKNITHLTCGFVGFEPQQVDIRNKSFVSIKLKESTTLNTVVITGYQKIEKRKLTSAISTVKADDIMQGGVASIDQMLGGQIAGAVVTPIGGAPGAPAKIRIRGTASMNGTQDPLWVLDGVPLEGTELPDLSGSNVDQLFTSSIAGINPADIQDITIMKDAASTAIYGARAANGVILITTKKGREGRPIVQFNSRLSYTSRPNMDKLNLMNSSEKLDMELGLAKYADLDSDSNSKKGAVGRLFEQYGLWDQYRTGGLESLPTNIQFEIASLRRINTRWGDELYRTSVNQDHSLSINGGSDRATYYFSTGYYDELGSTIGTSLNRLNFTLKGSYKLLNNLNIGVAMFSTERKQKSYLTNTGSVTNPAQYSRNANPYLSIYDDAGNYIYDPDLSLTGLRFIGYNIIEERNNTLNQQKNSSLNSMFNIDWEIIPKLNFRTQLGLQRENTNSQLYGSKNSFYSRRERENSLVGDSYFIPKGGVIKNTDATLTQWNLKTLVEYNTILGAKHELDILLGNELRRTKNESVFTAGYGYNDQTLTTETVVFPDPSYGKSYPLFKKNSDEHAYVSYFTTLGYTFDRKYTFFGSVRVDGSDMFGVENKYRYQPLWAASGSWRMKEEKFLKEANWVNDLKLRLSYGLQGNIDKNSSKYIIGLIDSTTPLPGQTEETISPSNLPNDRLRWEKTQTWNAGLDFSMFNNRISISLDAYHRKSTDLISVKAIPLENGIETVSVNWASMVNKGLELNITSHNINTKNFKWSTTLNLSKNINNVEEEYVPSNSYSPSRKGHSVNSLFAFKTAGLDDQGYVLFQKGDKKVTAPDFFGLVDQWGIGFYEATLSNKELRDLYTYVGSTDPKISGGLINNFSLGRFSLNLSCVFNIGQWVKTQPFYNINSVDMDRGLNRTTQMNKVWSPENTSGTYPRMIGYGTEGGTRSGDFSVFNSGYLLPMNVFNDLDIWYKKISYMRISSIRLGYDVPIKSLTKIGISALRLNVEGQNLFVVGTSHDGYFDPETYGNIYAQPIPKSVIVGLNVTF